MSSLFRIPLSECDSESVDSRLTAAYGELAKVNPARVLTGPEETLNYRTDFSRACDYSPGLVVKASHSGDVIDAMVAAEKFSLPYCFRGHSHSTGSQTIIEHGMVIASTPAAVNPIRHAEDLFEFQGRSRLENIEMELNKLGFTLPVIPDYLPLTLGGVLAVGGFGVRSVKAGVLLEHVEALQIVTPGGRMQWCSKDENQELYQMGLGTCGGIGYIESVLLRVKEKHEVRTYFRAQHKSLSDLIELCGLHAEADLKALDEFGLCTENGTLTSYFSGGDYSETNPLSHLNAFARAIPVGRADDMRFRVSAQVQRGCDERDRDLNNIILITEFAFSPNDAVRFIENMQHDADWPQIARYVFNTVMLLGTHDLGNVKNFPLSPVAHLQDKSVGIGFFLIGDRQIHSDLKEVASLLTKKCLSFAARPYRHGAFEFSESVQQELYGLPFSRLQKLRRKLDPKGLMRTGF